MDVKNVMADFSYSGKNFASEVRKIIGSKIEIVKKMIPTNFLLFPSVGLLNVLLLGSIIPGESLKIRILILTFEILFFIIKECCYSSVGRARHW